MSPQYRSVLVVFQNPFWRLASLSRLRLYSPFPFPGEPTLWQSRLVWLSWRRVKELLHLTVTLQRYSSLLYCILKQLIENIVLLHGCFYFTGSGVVCGLTNLSAASFYSIKFNFLQFCLSLSTQSQFKWTFCFWVSLHKVSCEFLCMKVRLDLTIEKWLLLYWF